MASRKSVTGRRPLIRKARALRLSARLLKWYATHRRDLPWRRDGRDPYRVWISEILLQQTQVATVIPYYERFLTHFPTLAALAEAPLDDVLKTWEGAGYYSRARNLHAAAREVMTRFGGQIPREVDELETLPGIGRYTAGAIASIAFNRAVPVLDGNVARVLARYFNIEGDPRSPAISRVLWTLAEQLVPEHQAGNYNQALMDLGATICTPRHPACPACPIRRGCAARRLGRQDQLPTPRQRKPRPHQQIAAGIIWKGNRILIAKRFARDLLGGLWEFPGGHQEQNETLAQCVRREIHEELGIAVAVGEEFASVDHGYSHFSITLHVFHCRYLRGQPRAIGCAGWKWVSLPSLSRYAFPAANRRVIAKLIKNKGKLKAER